MKTLHFYTKRTGISHEIHMAINLNNKTGENMAKAKKQKKMDKKKIAKMSKKPKVCEFC